MKRNNVSIEVLVNNKPITEYHHNGKFYLEGRKNSSFKLRIHNHDPSEKILAVPSVDGLSVVDGELAGEDSPGYVIPPLSYIDIQGWRIDETKVSEFVFANKKHGYANATEQGGNEGALGVMFFKSKTDDLTKQFKKIIDKTNKTTIIHNHYNYPYGGLWYNQPTVWYSSTNDLLNKPRSIDRGSLTADHAIAENMSSSGSVAMYSASVSCNTVTVNSSSNSITTDSCVVDNMVDESLSVGYGDQVTSMVNEVEFDRTDTPFQTLVFYYDNRKGLERRGIIFNDKAEIQEGNPFPASKKYCKMPKNGW